MRLSATEAQYVLSYLIDRRRIRPADVDAALRSRRDEVRDLRARLEALGVGSSAGRKLRASRPAPRQRRRGRLSPRVRALRRQQGRYMALVRGLSAAEKAKVRAAREKQGMASALRVAASLSRKK
jgi:hypothetical protein